MRRLCAESSCSYPGRAVSLAVRAPMGVALRASPKGLDRPSNPTGAVARGAGLRASAKALEISADPKATRAARLAVTPGVMGQQSAEAMVVRACGTQATTKDRT